jgi:hypothetical protein
MCKIAACHPGRSGRASGLVPLEGRLDRGLQGEGRRLGHGRRRSRAERAAGHRRDFIRAGLPAPRQLILDEGDEKPPER